MSRDLKHWICRSIDNQFASFHLTRPEVINNSRSRIRFVRLTNNFTARKFFNFSQDFLWEAVPESIKRLSNVQTHDFPVACHRVFA